jgi:hypothetical protein
MSEPMRDRDELIRAVHTVLKEEASYELQQTPRHRSVLV